MYLIFPEDPTTEFLAEVIEFSKENFPQIEIISCKANDESYAATLEAISQIPNRSTILFIGHGEPTKLYGGKSAFFEKKELVTLKNVAILKDSKLILMACNSAEFIKSSRPMRNYSDGLGFGLLPSEEIELQVHKKIRDLDLSNAELDVFKRFLVDLFKKIISRVANGNVCMEELAAFVRTYINKLVNDFIINNKTPKISKLLFYVKKELTSG